MIFDPVFLGRLATLPYVWKIHRKNERHLRLVAHIFTKVSQNVYLISTHFHIFICQMGLQVMARPSILLRFLGYFHTFLMAIYFKWFIFGTFSQILRYGNFQTISDHYGSFHTIQTHCIKLFFLSNWWSNAQWMSIEWLLIIDHDGMKNGWKKKENC